MPKRKDILKDWVKTPNYFALVTGKAEWPKNRAVIGRWTRIIGSPTNGTYQSLDRDYNPETGLIEWQLSILQLEEGIQRSFVSREYFGQVLNDALSVADEAAKVAS